MNALEDEEDDSNKITVIQVCQEHDSASFVKSITLKISIMDCVFLTKRFTFFILNLLSQCCSVGFFAAWIPVVKQNEMRVTTNVIYMKLTILTLWNVTSPVSVVIAIRAVKPSPFYFA